jgi:hypothetical protein
VSRRPHPKEAHLAEGAIVLRPASDETIPVVTVGGLDNKPPEQVDKYYISSPNFTG